MISIIVCSINGKLFKQFEESVASTIGIEYEIIRIDNKNNRYNICEAYNLGASSAKFNYLCFAHEDILFKSNNWGLILKNIFEADDKIGIVGIAGSKYKSLAPSGWPGGQSALDCYNLVQTYGDEEINQVFNPEPGNPLVEVKTLDGVFLFTKKAVWEQNQFDSDTFKGFHCYDLDFCLQAGKNYKLMVCYQLLIEHFSSGSENKNWAIASIQLSKKWNQYLPVGEVDHKNKIAIEWRQKRLFALKMKINGFGVSQILPVFFGFGYLKFFSWSGNISFIKEFITSIKRKVIK